MQKISKALLSILEEFNEKINAITIADLYAKPQPSKWSKIEILGHLVDSAQNNLRRFLCCQYESPVPLIVYDQDFWVNANGYHQASKDDVMALWILLNRRIAHVLSTMSPNYYKSLCNVGRHEPQLRTLKWLADDYLNHIKHHLDQILPGSFTNSQ
jgi:hypothetical protein